MLKPLLQIHSRRLADAYLRLGLALEFHPDSALQASSEKYVASACNTLEKRLEALQARETVLQNNKDNGEDERAPAVKESQEAGEELFEKDNITTMDSEQVEKEQKDVKEMIQELKLKLVEDRSNSTAANGTLSSNGKGHDLKETLKQAINESLLGSSTNALGAPPLTNPNAPVNDLSAMVKKKKKVEDTTASNGKRKESSNSEADGSKRAKVE